MSSGARVCAVMITGVELQNQVTTRLSHELSIMRSPPPSLAYLWTLYPVTC